jgi:2,3,4,5-tetrahydropyridine-2-carboxylate N-succinyltransferase
MSNHDLTTLEKSIEAAFDARDGVSPATKGEVREAVEDTLNLLDRGAIRVAERQADGVWKVNQWLKKAVLLSFRLNAMEIIKGGPGEAPGGTRCRPSSTAGARRLREGRFPRRAERVVRRSAYIAPGAS